MMTARPVLFGALLVTSLGLLPACTPDRTTQGTVTTGGSTGMRLDGRGGAPTTPTPSGTAGTLGGTAR
jgi:hypothetical protein